MWFVVKLVTVDTFLMGLIINWGRHCWEIIYLKNVRMFVDCYNTEPFLSSSTPGGKMEMERKKTYTFDDLALKCVAESVKKKYNDF